VDNYIFGKYVAFNVSLDIPCALINEVWNWSTSKCWFEICLFVVAEKKTDKQQILLFLIIAQRHSAIDQSPAFIQLYHYVTSVLT
jgi:hypothetical protein